MPNILDDDSFALLVGPPTIFTAPSASVPQRDQPQNTGSPRGDFSDPDIDWTLKDPFAFLDMPLHGHGFTADQTDYSDPLGPIDRETTSQGAAFDLGLLNEEDANEASASPVRGGAYESDSTSIWGSKAPALASGTLYMPNPSDLPSHMPTSNLESDTEHRNQLRETLRGYEGLSALDSDAIEKIIDGIFKLNSNNQLPGP